MNIKCLFGHHEWEFSYNYGVPLGCSNELWDKLVKEKKTFPVNCCTRCGKEDCEPDAQGRSLRAEGRRG